MSLAKREKGLTPGFKKWRSGANLKNDGLETKLWQILVEYRHLLPKVRKGNYSLQNSLFFNHN